VVVERIRTHPMFMSFSGEPPPGSTETVIAGLQNIFSSLLTFVEESKTIFLGVDLEDRVRSSRSLPQLAQTLEVAWLNLDGEDDVYSKKHLVWLCCLVAVTELSRDSVLNFYGGAKLLLKALTDLIQVIQVPEHLWRGEAEDIDRILDDETKGKQMRKTNADVEASASGLASVRLPRSACKAVGLWPERHVAGSHATVLSATLMFVPGGFTLAASIIGTAMLFQAGRREYNRTDDENEKIRVLETKCFEKAENLLRRKVSPIRLTNALVQEMFPETLKLCLFHENDILELIPAGGINGPGVGYCAKGCEAALRPPVSKNGNEVFKLKVFRPRPILNEPLLTIMNIRRGDKIMLAPSPLKPREIIAQRI